VFDLETTGFSRNYHDIIEICAILTDSDGVVADKDVATFHSLVKPPTPISPVITGITGISDETVQSAPSFQECGADFIKFLRDNCKRSSSIGGFAPDGFSSHASGDSNDDEMHRPLRDIVLVAQNGNRFDIPFLFKSLDMYGVDIEGIPFKGKIDTIDLVKCAIRQNTTLRVPENFRLATLYNLATGLVLEEGHRAMNDANATLCILQAESFWNSRKEACKVIANVANISGNNTPTSRTIVEEDSDTEVESDLEEDNTTEEVDSTIIEDGNSGSRWMKDTPFIAPNEKEMYEEVFTRNDTRNNTEHVLTGLKISKNTVNSPLKAWNFIFTEPLLNKIVRCTNDYGQEKSSRLTDISTGDLKEFIGILFLSSVQKWKDKPNNWWSDDPLMDFLVVKEIMSGRKFHTILRYLHVCDMKTQPSAICEQSIILSYVQGTGTNGLCDAEIQVSF
jgi:DNA polymerase III epsilon subunit-like protein